MTNHRICRRTALQTHGHKVGKENVIKLKIPMKRGSNGSDKTILVESKFEIIVR